MCNNDSLIHLEITETILPTKVTVTLKKLKKEGKELKRTCLQRLTNVEFIGKAFIWRWLGCVTLDKDFLI